MTAAIDNDVLFKGACYRLLDELASRDSMNSAVGVLGSARFVVPKKIEKANLNGDRAKVLGTLNEFLSRATELEPAESEQKMAADFELAAQKLALNLDIGESQLCAIVVQRALDWLVTGDKRAIAAIEMLLCPEPRLMPLCGRVKCLEQLFADAIGRHGHATLRSAVCTEPEIDKALTICFSCKSETVDCTDVAEGLLSYIRDLRERAKQVLAP